MSLARTLNRWTVRSLRTLTLVSALGLPAAAARAQAPAPAEASMPKRTYTKSAVFDLPVQMQESLRANLKEVRLYVRTPSSPWRLQETGQPSLTRFTYRVPEDGEYWFSLATVEKSGRMTPEDVNAEPPCLRVVVDRQPPVVQAQAGTSPEGEPCLRCTVQDPNADPGTLRATARTATGAEVPLEPVAGQPGTFRMRGAEGAAVRVTAVDLAGNVATHEVAAAGGRPAEASTASARPETRSYASPLPRGDAVPPTITNGTPPAVINVGNDAAAAMPKGPAPLPAAAPTPPPVTQVAHVPPPVEAGPALATVPAAPQNGTDAAPRGSGPAGRQILNTTRANIDFRIDQVGPSGISKLEAFVTTDQGQSWQRLREYTDRRSPIDIELPGEGIFGLRLVVTNGNGFGGAAPKRGDSPDCWIEVDTTGPFVQLRPIELVPQAGQLDVRWTASDKNLGNEPVNLYFRTQADAPWRPIARNLKNDGSYRWTFPRDAGSHFYFKVEVADQAGNVTRIESPTPLVLDMTEPRASVIQVSGTGGGRVTNASGN